MINTLFLGFCVTVNPTTTAAINVVYSHQLGGILDSSRSSHRLWKRDRPHFTLQVSFVYFFPFFGWWWSAGGGMQREAQGAQSYCCPQDPVPCLMNRRRHNPQRQHSICGSIGDSPTAHPIYSPSNPQTRKTKAWSADQFTTVPLVCFYAPFGGIEKLKYEKIIRVTISSEQIFILNFSSN